MQGLGSVVTPSKWELPQLSRSHHCHRGQTNQRHRGWAVLQRAHAELASELHRSLAEAAATVVGVVVVGVGVPVVGNLDVRVV